MGMASNQDIDLGVESIYDLTRKAASGLLDQLKQEGRKAAWRCKADYRLQDSVTSRRPASVLCVSGCPN